MKFAFDGPSPVRRAVAILLLSSPPLVSVSPAAGGLWVAPGQATSGALAVAAAPPVGPGPYDKYVAPIGECPGADLPGAGIGEQVSSMRCLIDYARRQKGISVLTMSSLLSRSATLKAHDQVNCDDFSHTACGRPFIDSFERAGYITPQFRWKVGENLAYDARLLGTPRATMRAWLYSDEHRKNIFEPSWRDQGLALLVATSFLGLADNSVWVSHFGHREARAGAPASPSRRRGKLRLSASPHRVALGHPVHFKFRVRTSSGRSVAHAFITLAGRRARTSKAGRAKMTLTLRRVHRYSVRASKRGHRSTTAFVKAHA